MLLGLNLTALVATGLVHVIPEYVLAILSIGCLVGFIAAIVYIVLTNKLE